MGKLLSFLFSTFSDKEGTTRAGSTMIAVLTIVYYLFTPSTTFTDFKANVDSQNALLWKNIGQLRNENIELRNTLSDHNIPVHELPVDFESSKHTQLQVPNEHQAP